jgi:predicted HTH domain antitoxin
MSEINPNTPVDAPSEPNVGSGEGPISFDDLDLVMSQKSGKGSSRQAKESSEKESKKDDKPKESKESGDAESKKAKDEKDGEKKDEPKVEEVKKKTYKAKAQDKELDLDEDAVFTVKVNGQEVEVPLKDIVSNYSGKVAWDKKFTELSKKELEFRKSSEGLNKDKQLIRAVFSEQNPDLRLFKMAELAGVSPLEFRKAYFDENIKMLENYQNMTDDEKKAAELAFENSYLKHQSETREKSLSAQQAQAELKQKTDQLLATHAVTESEFVEIYDRVVALADENGNVSLKRQGREVSEKLTPELIIEIVEKERLWKEAETKFGTLKLGIPEDQMAKQIVDLVERAYLHGIKPADIPEIIDSLWGNKKTQKVIAEKIREKQEFTEPRKPVPSAQSRSEPMFFDELM